ncbi:MAG: hypothetical protein MJ085_04200 [Clostridia bacterium]|nr:hypothetical protein [Clostridia bacterium]
MKSKCQTRKSSIYAFLALVFALVMLFCAVVCVSLHDQFQLQWLQLRFEDAGRAAKAVSALLPVACAVIVLAVCLTFCLGLKPRNLLVAAGALLVFSLCRYVADLYLTVTVERENFYVISMAHIDLAFSLVIFLVTLLTVCNLFKNNVFLTLTAMALGLLSLVFTVLQTGGFYRDGVADLSGTVYYLSGCMAVALCALTLEWNTALKAKKMTEETAAQPVEPAPAETPIYSSVEVPNRDLPPLREEVPAWEAPAVPVQQAPVPQMPVQQEPQQVTSEQTLALLQQVQKLHESGILDDDEYREKCKKILKKI